MGIRSEAVGKAEVADEEKADEKAGGDLVAGEAYGRI
jgi:hypothetical protein